MDSCFKCLPLPFLSWTLLPTLPYWWLDSNQRFKLTATGIDGISIHWYISIWLREQDSNLRSRLMRPSGWPTSTSRYVVVTEGLEPPTGGRPNSAHETDVAPASQYLWWGDGIEPPAQDVSNLCSTYWATAPFTCSLVVDSHSRFTILSQQVNVLYEFPVSYNHNIF